MDAEWDWIRQLGAVALVMGLLAAAMWALRQAGWFNAGITGAGTSNPARGEIQRRLHGSRGPLEKLGLVVRGWLGARRPHADGGDACKIISMDRLALTPQHFLHVVRAGQRDLLIATHPQGCGLIADLGNAAESGKPEGNAMTLQQATATAGGNSRAGAMKTTESQRNGTHE